MRYQNPFTPPHAPPHHPSCSHPQKPLQVPRPEKRPLVGVNVYKRRAQQQHLGFSSRGFSRERGYYTRRCGVLGVLVLGLGHKSSHITPQRFTKISETPLENCRTCTQLLSALLSQFSLRTSPGATSYIPKPHTSTEFRRLKEALKDSRPRCHSGASGDVPDFFVAPEGQLSSYALRRA